jgi:hypothetical protein
LFENEKQTQLFQMLLEKYPYLNPNWKEEEMMSTCALNMNENTWKYIQHDFKDEIKCKTCRCNYHWWNVKWWLILCYV